MYRIKVKLHKSNPYSCSLEDHQFILDNPVPLKTSLQLSLSGAYYYTENRKRKVTLSPYVPVRVGRKFYTYNSNNRFEPIENFISQIRILRKDQDRKNDNYLKMRQFVNLKTGQHVRLSDLKFTRRKEEVSLLLNSFYKSAEHKMLTGAMITCTLNPQHNHNWKEYAISPEYFLATIQNQYEILDNFIKSIFEDKLFREPTPKRMEALGYKTPWIYINKKTEFIYILMFEFTKNYNLHFHQVVFAKKEKLHAYLSVIGRKKITDIEGKSYNIGRIDIMLSENDKDILEKFDLRPQPYDYIRRAKMYLVPSYSPSELDSIFKGNNFQFAVLTHLRDREKGLTDSMMRYAAKYVSKTLNEDKSIPVEKLIFPLLQKQPFRYSRGVVFPLTYWRKSHATLVKEFYPLSSDTNNDIHKEERDAALYHLQNMITNKELKIESSNFKDKTQVIEYEHEGVEETYGEINDLLDYAKNADAFDPDYEYEYDENFNILNKTKKKYDFFFAMDICSSIQTLSITHREKGKIFEYDQAKPDKIVMTYHQLIKIIEAYVGALPKYHNEIEFKKHLAEAEKTLGSDWFGFFISYLIEEGKQLEDLPHLSKVVFDSENTEDRTYLDKLSIARQRSIDKKTMDTVFNKFDAMSRSDLFKELKKNPQFLKDLYIHMHKKS